LTGLLYQRHERIRDLVPAEPWEDGRSAFEVFQHVPFAFPDGKFPAQLGAMV
jgi:hypothetical protein